MARTATVGALTALLLAALVLVPSAAVADTLTIQPISSDGETVPGSHAGDSIDDPAVWVHPTDPSRSLVIANDKLGSLDTYDPTSGALVQRVTSATSFWGNVDVRQGVTVDGVDHDLVGAVNGGGVRFYGVDPDTRQLVATNEGGRPIGAQGEGFCLYESPSSHRVYGFVITIAGQVSQFLLQDADHDGLLESSVVRTFAVGSEAEGCVADDRTGALYVSEEDVALWRYDAEPTGGTTRRAVDTVAASGGRLAPDIEGLTVVHRADGSGYLMASVQGGADPTSYFAVYDTGPSNGFVKTFRVTDGSTSDDCDHTDGITAVTASLGPAYPRGVFVCQDGTNSTPGGSGDQDVKLVRLERVVDLDVDPPPPSDVAYVGGSAVNVNATSFAVTVPASVRAGDALLLFASQATATPLTGPGAGWTQEDSVVDGAQVTTLWSHVATASDAGSTVRLATGTTYTKLALTLAAYRGTDTTDPVASATGEPEPGTTAAHTTPTHTASDGAWRVSYWSDRTGATTSWTPPTGETVRRTTAGTGGGRIASLLTDPGHAVAAGTTGGLTAVADAAAASATSWTVLLRPAPTPAAEVTHVGTDATDVNATRFQVTVPAGVQPGDTLLLFASAASTTPLTGPGAGWTAVDQVTDDGLLVTRLWRRTAGAGEAGTTVQLSSGSTYVKVALTLAAYRGADPQDPVAAYAAGVEGTARAAHTTPTVSTPVAGRRVSYWSDRNSATASWTPPADETVRSTVTGTGGGRISALLTDAATAVGPTGGVTATASAGSSTATTWTLVLRPAS